ncbi:thiamine ABC transporter substrate-binding protein [Nocardioides daejeonensis]|uniref:thiamine ABC transporter substrate-binding protein n=1 Tax=Nocardioides daejeonensis TaxID=1046556 RepID=UPI00194F985C|nr:thiamine ABC transporter substrate-binding protein [Nocardioides daejeonensis]
MRRRTRRAGLLGLALATALSGCSLMGGTEKHEASGGTDPSAGPDELRGTTVVLATHESFSLPKKLVKAFQEETGITLTVRPSGDAGELTTKLALNADNPFADLAFGVDNTFATRAVEAGVFADTEVDLPASAEKLRLEGKAASQLVPVDQASVCVNVDTAWFADHDQSPPQSFDDLADPAWRDLTAIPAATTSSPGLAFLLATIAEFGEDGWQGYWERLLDNGAKLSSGWSDAYYSDFTGGGEGDRPIVVSYDTSPAFTIDEESGTSTTEALLDTCFRQVEYAGVLAGAKNPAGAARVLEFLLSPEVQAALPEQMYVFPVDDTVKLPADWAAYAKQPSEPLQVSSAEIDENRQKWLTEWTDLTSR